MENQSLNTSSGFEYLVALIVIGILYVAASGYLLVNGYDYSPMLGLILAILLYLFTCGIIWLRSMGKYVQ